MIRVLSKCFRKIIKPWHFLILLVIAFLFRFFLIPVQSVVSFDEVNYLKLAVYGARQGLPQVLHTYWSPLYPLIIALISKIFSNAEFIARFISVLTGSLVLIPVYVLARHRLPRTISLITVAMLAVYPPLVLLSTKIITEPLYSFLGITGIMIGWYALGKESRRLALGTGIIFGMTYLTRPEGMGFIIVFILIMVVLLIKKLIEKEKSKFLQMMFISLLGFIFISSPYLLFLHKKTGEWTISAKQKSLQQAEADVFQNKKEDWQFRNLSADNKSLLIDQMFHIGNFIKAEQQRGKPVVQITVHLLMKKYMINMYTLLKILVPKIIPLSLAVFMILGFFVKTNSRKKIIFDLFILSFILFYWGIIIPLFHINQRYFLPLLPLGFIWAGQGTVILHAWLKHVLNKLRLFKKNRLFINLLSIVIVVFFLLLSYVPGLIKIVSDNSVSPDIGAKPVEYKKAGLWIKEHCEKTPIVMSHYQTVSYYAGNFNIAESVSIPFDTIERILEYAKYRGVDYIVLSERYVELFPRIRPLFYMKNIPGQLKAVYNFESKAGLKVVIYKLINTT